MHKRIVTVALAFVAILFVFIAVSQAEECSEPTLLCAEAVYNSQGHVWIAPTGPIRGSGMNEPLCSCDLSPEHYSIAPYETGVGFPEVVVGKVTLEYETGSPTFTWGALWDYNGIASVYSTLCPGWYRDGSTSLVVDAYDVAKQIDDFLHGIGPRPWFYMGQASSVAAIVGCGDEQPLSGVALIVGLEYDGVLVNPTWLADESPALVTTPPPGCRPDCPEYDKATVEHGTFTQVRRLYQ